MSNNSQNDLYGQLIDVGCRMSSSALDLQDEVAEKIKNPEEIKSLGSFQNLMRLVEIWSALIKRAVKES